MLSKLQLKRLRNDIKLNSLYYSDYQNRYNINEKQVCDFFDSYIQYLNELEQENIQEGLQQKELDFNGFFEKYDNIENLYNYYNCYDIDPLSKNNPYYKELYN